MDRIYTDAYRLKKLRTLIESGEFVWSARKACDLLDSIYCNYSIGTVLVSKTNRRNEGKLRRMRTHGVSVPCGAAKIKGRSSSLASTRLLMSDRGRL